MHIHISTTPARKKPKAGDEKTVKGVTMIRQQARIPVGLPHAGAYIVSGGRPVWEWVVKGSESDRSTRKEPSHG
ncbi:hypothetical protein D9M70_461970 [compost metagenome]